MEHRDRQLPTSRPGPIQIMVVDDHQVVRCGIRRILEEELGNVGVEECANAEEATNQLFSKSFDLIILDLSMPGKGGLEFLEELHSRNVRTPVLVQTFHQQSEFAVRALRAGAMGYVTKNMPVDAFADAVRKLLSGGRYVGSEIADNVLADFSKHVSGSKTKLLSNREYEVMLRLARGASCCEIADELHISSKTVGTYRMRIFEKMGFQRNVDLTLYAVRHGLIDQLMEDVPADDKKMDGEELPCLPYSGISQAN